MLFMTYSYGKDLRSLVVRKVSSWMSQQAAAEMFEIGKSTVSDWMIQYCKYGSLEPHKRHRYKKRVSDDDLLSYIRKLSDATLPEIPSHFNMGITTIFYRSDQLEINRKKTRYIHDI